MHEIFTKVLIIINTIESNRKFKVALTYNLRPSDFISEFSERSINKEHDYNDQFAEWDTEETIYAIRDALAEHHEIIMIEANLDAFEKFRMHKPDLVFNVSEGQYGISREAQIPAMLDFLNIPYTGSDPLTLAICLDKARTKEILSYHNVRTPSFRVVNSSEKIDQHELNFPLFIKPLGEGSSKGIFDNSLVNDFDSLQKLVMERLNDYNQPVIIEEYLPGREFTVAVLGNEPDLIVLPIIELNFRELPNNMTPIYSYEAKWILDRIDNPLEIYSCPADIEKELETKIRTISKQAYTTLNCKDWSRIDVRLDKNGEPNIIEVNPLPGILPDPRDNSCYPKAARTYGLNYNELINQVLLHAAKRNGLL